MLIAQNKIFETPLGDSVYRNDDSVVIQFQGQRNVVSTSALNGGYKESLQFAFNNSCGKHKDCHKMKADTLEGHYSVIAHELGLEVSKTTGMSTAALVENMATVTKSYGPLTVSAMVTAGVDNNGGRAGDLATYDELNKEHINKDIISGTINTFININARLPEGTLVRALMTATEAKTAALQELMANSCYSNGLATGSGTDSAIIIGNLDSDIYLTNAGKHCVLGELIGKAVKEATKQALDLQAGMNTIRQARISFQNKRYGITRDAVRKYYINKAMSPVNDEIFNQRFDLIDANPSLVALYACYIHLVDQFQWGLLLATTVADNCWVLLNNICDNTDIELNEMKSIFNHEDFNKNMIEPLIAIMAIAINNK